MAFVLRSIKKAMGEHSIKWRRNTFLDFDYAEDLSIPDVSVSKMNECQEILRVQGARISLKINVKRTPSLRLGIRPNEKVILGNAKIDQMASFIYLGSTINKDVGSSEDVKSRLAKTQDVLFLQLKKVRKNRKISFRNKIRILEAAVVIVAKYG